jgi:hypothetical protein
MKVLCIDPGVTCGLAFFEGGELSQLESGRPVDAIRQIGDWGPEIVVMEDARLTKHIWHGSGVAGSQARAKAIGANVGMNRGIGLVIIQVCEMRGLKTICISPNQKGAKVGADQFRQLTGWSGKSNQHERDAAMLYRAARFQIEAIMRAAA